MKNNITRSTVTLKGESVGVVINSDSLDYMQPDMLYNYFPIHIQEDWEQWATREYQRIRSRLIPEFYASWDAELIDKFISKLLLPILYYLLPDKIQHEQTQ